MQYITDNMFKQHVLSSQVPAVVLFETGWSGHCQIMLMILERLDAAWDGRVVFYNLDVEKNQEAAGQYKVGRVPTILIFRKGDLLDRMIGVISEAELSTRIYQWVQTPFE